MIQEKTITIKSISWPYGNILALISVLSGGRIELPCLTVHARIKAQLSNCLHKRHNNSNIIFYDVQGYCINNKIMTVFKKIRN